MKMRADKLNQKTAVLYLDNAATTFPKPPSVTEAVMQCMRHTCGNPGRGSHRLALAAAEEIFVCREEAASFFGAPDPSHVIFTMNATYALNTAIKSTVRSGDHVLIGSMEHNSVWRPIARLAAQKRISYSVFSVRGSSEEILADIRRKMRPETRVLICAHVPNIANMTMPVDEIGRLCRKYGIAFILDGAQSAGHLPIDVSKMGIDLLCVPGHKGLYGPQGCGMIVAGSDRFVAGETLIEGGSGMHSLDAYMPDVLPERYEAGTLPTPCVAGLREGIRFVKQIGTDAVHTAESALWKTAVERLSEMSEVCLYDGTPGSVLLFNISGMLAVDVGTALDRQGICVRSGYHCAPMAHRTLGTEQQGGVRASFGIFNTEKDVLRFTDAVWHIIGDRKNGV